MHGNADVYLGGPLQFNDHLTSHGDMYHRRKDVNSIVGNARIRDDDGVLQPMVIGGWPLDSADPEWMTKSLERWDGRVKTAAHAVSRLELPINPLDVPHDIIEHALPTGHADYDAMTESEKFANKAALRIHVDASGNFTATDFHGQDVTARFNQAQLVESGAHAGNPTYEKDGDGHYTMATPGSLDTTQQFTDLRENKTMASVDIYVDQLLTAFPELYSGTTYGVDQGRGIVYVTRDDPDGAGGVQPVLRVRNGRDLPNGGLTFASDLPVYVEGNYNVDSGVKPGLVAADAVTLLSKAWQDALSGSGIGSRVADSSTYNAVIMTGNTPTLPFEGSLGGQYNGGLENVLRFLERWSGKTVTFRGSIIDIWFSEIAVGEWQYGHYYTAPNRDWGYDEMFRTAAPPGIPRVFGIEELAWSPSSWEDEGWD